MTGMFGNSSEGYDAEVKVIIVHNCLKPENSAKFTHKDISHNFQRLTSQTHSEF